MAPERTLAPPLCRLVADRLEVVAVGIEDVRAVAVGVIDGAYAWGAVVDSPGFECPALYEPEAVMAYPPGDVTAGRDAIRALWEQVPADAPAFEPEEPLPTLINGDIA